MNYPKTINDLIECYRKLPGIGEKSAERYALATIDLNEEIIDLFAKSVKNVKNKIKRCTICNNLCEGELCEVCKDPRRNRSIICVVEDPKSVILFEKLGSFNGTYHVLDGLISPLEGIGVDQIKIDLLLNRIKKEEPKEIILAVKPSIEGETTSLYISKMLEKYNIIISKIAHGIPLGAEMEYIDALTLELALEDRKRI